MNLYLIMLSSSTKIMPSVQNKKEYLPFKAFHDRKSTELSRLAIFKRYSDHVVGVSKSHLVSQEIRRDLNSCMESGFCQSLEGSPGSS